MSSLCGMVALHDLHWNFLFSCQMICNQHIILNHVFFQYESNLEPVTFMCASKYIYSLNMPKPIQNFLIFSKRTELLSFLQDVQIKQTLRRKGFWNNSFVLMINMHSNVRKYRQFRRPCFNQHVSYKISDVFNIPT